MKRLNPCLGGIWSWSYGNYKFKEAARRVLILVWVEYGLGDIRDRIYSKEQLVLILVWVEYGLGGRRNKRNKYKQVVLILVWVEYGLGDSKI